MSTVDQENPIPVIFGCSRPALTPIERKLFEEVKPFGFILFKRNCEDPDQVRWLIKELRQACGREDVPIFIDQEGGRVSRLQPPHWPKFPPARIFGMMYEKDPEWGQEAVQLYARIVANELWKLDIEVNCAPVLDLFIEGATPAIGDRAMSRRPAIVAALGRIWCETFLNNGVMPVIKHLPGHGRLKVDPHNLLPVIGASRAELETEDFVPFELLKDIPIGMNSHAVFTALDRDVPASMSPVVHSIIRDMIGFDGLLLSDDITMKALNDAPEALAQKALEAGTDVVLHCNADMAEMEAIGRALSPMNKESWARWEYAKSMVKKPDPAYNSRQDSARLDVLLGAIAYGVETTT
ncbi:MAG TPA: glycoside hydrolase family 3 N-terminal domain-containing protein [Alphaproteobacteria bacterium]|nr:glycoside hydrolase family 3 N-terminal domain-containing protein [Alphaproteobacteria bacterium]